MLDVSAGLRPPRNLHYTLSGRTRRLLLFTTDQGYPRYESFAMAHPVPNTRPLLVYNGLQEAIRKHAERLDAVVPSPLNIKLRPERFTTVERMTSTGRTVAIPHIMAIEFTRTGFLAHYDLQESPEIGRPADELALHGADRDASGRDSGRDKDSGQRFVVNDEPSVPGVWVPPVPTDDQGRDPSYQDVPKLNFGSLRYTQGAECESKDKDAHFDPLRDLSEHVWRNSGRLLLPYI